MRTSALIANGAGISKKTFLSQIQQHSRIIAVDGGLAQCYEMGIIPHLLVGDLDSAPTELVKKYSSVPRLLLPRDKDQTDLEVAIEHERREGSSQIILFGAWGKRIDHSLTNALILGRYPNLMKLETETEVLFAIHDKTHISCKAGQTLSLIPLYGKATGVSTWGLKWELVKGTLDYMFIGISNICLNEQVTISVDHGLLLCCLEKNFTEASQ